MEDNLSRKIESLPTIKDIDELLSTHLTKFKAEVREEFKNELKLRDDRIETLENTIRELKDDLNSVGVISCNDDLIVDDEKWDVDSDSDAVKDDLDFVSVGDSIIQHLDPKTIVPGKSVDICLRGKSTTEVNARLKEEFKSKNIKCIAIHSGSNSVPEKSPDEVASELITGAKTIKNTYPETKVIISAVLPKINPSYNRGINAINKKLYQKQKKYDYQFVQHLQFSQNGRFNLKMFSWHEVRKGRPIHLSREGLTCLSRNIKNCINQNSC